MNFWKKSPLLILLLIGWLVFGTVSYVNRDGIYREYEAKNGMSPVLASFFYGIKDGVYPMAAAKGADAEPTLPEAAEETAAAPETQAPAASGAEEAASQPEMPETPEPSGTGQADAQPETPAASGRTDAQSETSAATGTETAQLPDGTERTKEAAEPVQTEETETALENEAGSLQESGADSRQEEKEAQETRRSFIQVEESYFDDALFIGDSRTQGMLEYGGLQDRAAFYCQTSLTVYDLFEKEKAFIREGEEKLTLTEALSRHQFRKIYLMLGINEMGTGTAESFFTAYADAVYKIRQLQPDAVLFVQGIMRVAGKKSASDPIFNNPNINIRNVEIQTLDNGQDIFYLDVNEVVCDENGNLHEDWTFDQIHLKAKYYQVWKEYLMAHGIET